MAKIYGHLEKAMLENIATASLPVSPPEGFICIDSTLHEMLYFNGSVYINLEDEIDGKISSTIVDAKGDLLTATASDTPARLAVGSNGTVLIADSGESTGLRWGTPGGGVPVGTIIAWVGGYFGDGSNGSFTNVLGNTVGDVNTLLNSDGWYVCDGSALNDAASSIFNGSGRYLPNLTDDRFLMGDTAAGNIGGSNTVVDHTHNAPVPGHYHGMGTGANLAIGASGSHTHYRNASNVYEYSIQSSTGSLWDVGAAGGYMASGDTTPPRVNVTGSQVSGHTHASGDFSGSIGLVTGGSNGNSTMNVTTNSTQSSVENRPVYLSCFYIMRVK